jgi:hypothetical protein
MDKKINETQEQCTIHSVSGSYFRKWYHSYEYCSKCFAKDDKHDMNCLECCPVKNGKVEKVMYANQQELQDKQNDSFKRLSRW